MAQEAINLLDTSVKPSKIVVLLAWPAIVEQLLQTMVQYVNTAMLGSLGAKATAAVAVNTSLIMLINGLMNAGAIGFAVQVARHIGAGEPEQAKRNVRQAMVFILAFGVFATVLMESVSGALPGMMGAEQAIIPDAVSYMRYMASVFTFNAAIIVCSNIIRCAGDTKTPMFFNLLTNILNIIGNFLLIFPTREITVLGRAFTMWGADMGVSGTGLSTALSTIVSGSLMVASVFIRRSPIQISLRGDYRPDRQIIKSMLSIGLPNAFERVTLSLGQIALTVLVASVGTTALAAHQLGVTAESIAYLPAFGFALSATTLTAQALGAGQKELAYKYGRLCTLYSVAFMTAAGVLMFIFPRQLIGIFTPDAAVIDVGARVLRIEALAEPFFAMSIVLFGTFRGAGDTRFPFYITVVGMWVVRMSIAYTLVHYFHMGLTGAWIGMALDLTVRGILCAIRFKKRRWLEVWKAKSAPEKSADPVPAR